MCVDAINDVILCPNNSGITELYLYSLLYVLKYEPLVAITMVTRFSSPIIETPGGSIGAHWSVDQDRNNGY